MDKDESLDEFLPPLLSSVLHIGPQEISGGELVINTKGFTDFFENPNPESYEGQNWIKIPFRFNQLVLFNPFLPHKVLSGSKNRVSFAINLWDKTLTKFD